MMLGCMMLSINANAKTVADTEQANLLVVSLCDGMKHCYTLNESISITPSADSITVASQHLNVAYARNCVKGYHFTLENQMEDGINDITIDNGSTVKIERLSNAIIIKGLPSGTKATVFNITGALCKPKMHYESDSDKTDIVINTSTLPHSTYIITFKGAKNIPSIKFNR